MVFFFYIVLYIIGYVVLEKNRNKHYIKKHKISNEEAIN